MENKAKKNGRNGPSLVMNSTQGRNTHTAPRPFRAKLCPPSVATVLPVHYALYHHNTIFLAAGFSGLGWLLPSVAFSVLLMVCNNSFETEAKSPSRLSHICGRGKVFWGVISGHFFGQVLFVFFLIINNKIPPLHPPSWILDGENSQGPGKNACEFGFF